MFELSFNTDNAAFDGNGLFSQSKNVLNGVGWEISQGKTEGCIYDTSGICIGEWRLTK